MICAISAACSTTPPSPNIIVIMGDDYSRGEHSIYGNPTIETPNIDSLISGSMSFDNFYGSPFGIGTRAQVMSGKHEFRVGVTHDRAPRSFLDINAKLLPNYLSEGGYATAHFGKWQLGSDAFDDEYSARNRGFSHSLVCPTYDHQDPTMLLNGESKAFEGYTTNILFSQAQKWISSKSKDAPFFCYIAPIAAHAPYVCPDEYSQKYAQEGNTANYYGMISNMDHNIGEFVYYLKANDLYDNTIIVYLTDNGQSVVGYNDNMRGGKGSKYRGGSRVPFSVFYSKLPTMGRATDELAGGIDLLPTLLDLCSLELDGEVEGVSLAPLLRGETDTLAKRYIVTHAGRWFDGGAEDQRLSRCAVASKRLRLVENRELFDIEQDPMESKNIIEVERHERYLMNLFFDVWWSETRHMMSNEWRAVAEGGSRRPMMEGKFREENQRIILSNSRYNPAIRGSEGAFLIEESPMLATTWDSVDPDIFPAGSTEREWVDREAARLTARLDSCKMAGVRVFAECDMIVLPTRLIDKFGLSEEFGSPYNPLIQDLLRAQIKEVFAQFPALDGLVVNLDKIYLSDAPYHSVSLVRRSLPELSIIPLMNLLREEACVNLNKKLIVRSSGAFDDNLENYLSINKSVKPHKNLFVGVNNCDVYSQRTEPFNMLIGEGRLRQIIELHPSREYEGDGVYPNYIGEGVLSGFEEHANMPREKLSSLSQFAARSPQLFGGVISWGSCANREAQPTLWSELNEAILMGWAEVPQKSEDLLFNNFARTRLGLNDLDTEKFARMCRVSAEAVIRGINTTQGDMDSAWSRVAGVSWPDLHGRNILNITRHKEASIMRWKEVTSLAKDIDWGSSATEDFVIGSSYFALHLYEIYQAVVNIAAAEIEGRTKDIPSWITRYDEAWRKFNSLSYKYAGITDEMIERYRKSPKTTHADDHINKLRK